MFIRLKNFLPSFLLFLLILFLLPRHFHSLNSGCTFGPLAYFFIIVCLFISPLCFFFLSLCHCCIEQVLPGSFFFIFITASSLFPPALSSVCSVPYSTPFVACFYQSISICRRLSTHPMPSILFYPFTFCEALLSTQN